MKIIKIKIIGFGVIQNKTYNLSDVNQIIAENGNGKSTLVSFIECMFYGMSSSSKDNHRRFLPWNKTLCGGYIIFKSQDKIYKVERTFGVKKSEDTFCLYDENDVPCKDYSDNLGEELFLLDRKSFISACVCSIDTDFAFNSQAVYQKLNSIITQNDQLDGFDKKLLGLEKSIKEYENAQRKGIIPNLRTKIEEIKDKIAPLLSCESALEEKLKQEQELLKELQILKDKILEQEKIIEESLLSSNFSSQQARKDLIDKQLVLLSDKLKEEADKINGKTLTKENLKIAQQKKQELTLLGKEVDSLKEQLSRLNFFTKNLPTVQELSNAKETYLELENLKATKSTKANQVKVNKGLSITLIIISFIMFFIGIFNFKKYLIFSISSLIIGGLFLVWAIINLVKKPLKTHTQTIQEKENFLRSFLLNYGYGGYDIYSSLSMLESDLIKEENKQVKIAELNSQISKKTRYLAQLKEHIANFFAFYNLDSNLENLAFLNQVFQNIEYYKLQISTLLQEKNLLENTSTFTEDLTLKKHKEYKQKLLLNKEELEEKIAKGKTQIFNLKNQLVTLLDLNDKLATAQQELKNALQEKSILEKTHYCLSQAKQNLTQGCLSPIKIALNEYASIVLPKYTNYTINQDFLVKFQFENVVRDFSDLSLGEKQIVFLCMKLGVIFATFKKELPFLIIDDAFAPLDEEKFLLVKNFIRQISKKLQILYLAPCNNRKL